MELPFERPEFEDDFKENLFYLSICLVFVSGMVAANNIMTDTEGNSVGPTEVYYECHGLDLGICLGVERPHHETVGYDNFEELLEEGSDEYYSRVEAELMIQAYNICEDQSLEGMDWLEEAEYEGQTGGEWYEMDEINLLGCEETFRFQVDE